MKQAQQIADDHGLRIVPVTQKGKPAWVVYRKIPHSQSGTRVGRRKRPAAVLALVKVAAGVTGAPAQPRKEEEPF